MLTAVSVGDGARFTLWPRYDNGVALDRAGRTYAISYVLTGGRFRPYG